MTQQREPDQDFGAPPDRELTTAELAGAAPSTAAQAEAGREERSFRNDVEAADDAAPVFPTEEADDLRHEWDAIQTSFVDEPRKAVEQADHLVAATMKRLAESFAEERARLEGHWDRGDDVSTEDLRVALRRYRAFFGRLLSA